MGMAKEEARYDVIFGFGRLVWGNLATISEDDSEK